MQEWWGLDSGIKDDGRAPRPRGFVALVPDLYHGELAEHTEMDKAAQLMTELPPDRAARDMSGAVDYLAGHDAVTSDGIGVVGFCMGGMLAFLLATSRPDKIEGRRRVLRLPAGRHRSPTGRSSKRRCAGTWPRTTTSSVPTRRARSSRSCRAWARTCSSRSTPAPGTRSWPRTTRSGTRDEALAEKIWPEVVGFLHGQLG